MTLFIVAQLFNAGMIACGCYFIGRFRAQSQTWQVLLDETRAVECEPDDAKALQRLKTLNAIHERLTRVYA